MKITAFNAIKDRNKVPKSPYDDNSFVFITKDVSTLKECFDIMSEEWILSNSLCIEEPLKSTRDKNALSQHRCPKSGVVTLDIDDIKSYTNMRDIITYFKSQPFNIILGKSKNWDGKKKFNLKGFIEVEFDTNWKNVKEFLSILNEFIGNKGNVDLSASSDVSLQAPLLRNEVLLLQESFEPVKYDYIDINRKFIEVKKESEFIQSFDTSKLINICFDIYRRKGFSVVHSRNNETINWQHPSEVKSKGGYFTYITAPHIMHHHNKDKSFNIFNEIKETKEGKEFIKEQTSYSLKKQFEKHKKTYHNELIVNKQLIEIDDRVKKFLTSFMENGDVLKIKSAMGTGKSIMIDEIISQSRELSKRVLLVSNRVSVALDYSNKYSIKTYLSKGDEIWQPGEDLIVQLDSLFRYDLRDFDIVVLDEMVSLLFQTISALKDNMRPYNAAKLFHILKSKKIVMADAFLSGYEDRFYTKKNIYYFQNDYRDKIDVSYYSDKDTFAEDILKCLGEKRDDETVTASIISNNALNTIYDICTEAGFKVFKLTSNTSEETKSYIYKLFEEDSHDKWDLLLFSPTLTVGVSNMNNCTHHFHYDEGKAADVISSLQMVKRTRRMKHLHLYLNERTLLEPTDSDTIDDLFKQNIEKYFKNSANTSITVQLDDNGNFNLSPVGEFMNKITALYNQLENSHRMSFNVLLEEQFEYLSVNNVKYKSSIDFKQRMSDTKENIKQNTLDLIEEHRGSMLYSDKVQELLSSRRSLSEDEKISIVLYELKQKTNGKVSDNDMIDIAKDEVTSEYMMSFWMQNLSILYRKDIIKINNLIDTILTSGTKSAEFVQSLNVYKDMGKLIGMRLQDWYSEKDIKEIQSSLKLHDMKQVLKKIGYMKKESRYLMNPIVKKNLKFFL